MGPKRLPLWQETFVCFVFRGVAWLANLLPSLLYITSVFQVRFCIIVFIVIHFETGYIGLM